MSKVIRQELQTAIFERNAQACAAKLRALLQSEPDFSFPPGVQLDLCRILRDARLAADSIVAYEQLLRRHPEAAVADGARLEVARLLVAAPDGRARAVNLLRDVIARQRSGPLYREAQDLLDSIQLNVLGAALQPLAPGSASPPALPAAPPPAKPAAAPASKLAPDDSGVVHLANLFGAPAPLPASNPSPALASPAGNAIADPFAALPKSPTAIPPTERDPHVHYPPPPGFRPAAPPPISAQTPTSAEQEGLLKLDAIFAAPPPDPVRAQKSGAVPFVDPFGPLGSIAAAPPPPPPPPTDPVAALFANMASIPAAGRTPNVAPPQNPPGYSATELPASAFSSTVDLDAQRTAARPPRPGAGAGAAFVPPPAAPPTVPHHDQPPPPKPAASAAVALPAVAPPTAPPSPAAPPPAPPPRQARPAPAPNELAEAPTPIVPRPAPAPASSTGRPAAADPDEFASNTRILELEKLRQDQEDRRKAQEYEAMLERSRFSIVLPPGKRIHFESACQVLANFLGVTPDDAAGKLRIGKGIVLDGLSYDDMIDFYRGTTDAQQKFLYIRQDETLEFGAVQELLSARPEESQVRLTTEKAQFRCPWEKFRLISVGRVLMSQSEDSSAVLLADFYIDGTPRRHLRLLDTTFNFRAWGGGDHHRADPFRSIVLEWQSRCPGARIGHTVHHLQKLASVDLQVFQTVTEYEIFNRWLLLSHLGEEINPARRRQKVATNF